MRVKKLVLEPCEVKITGATLLTVDEARKLLTGKDRDRGLWWWLRSPGHFQNDAALVNDDGSVDACGVDVSDGGGGVRPALKIENLALSNLKIGDIFYFGGKLFKLISDRLALCETIIGTLRFDESSNNYESSEIKASVDAWFVNTIKRGSDT